MKKYDIPITKENILSTYEDDLLKRNEYLYDFIKLLLSTNENFSIAVDGAWGSGKTFFIKQLEMLLSVTNPHINSEYSEERVAILKSMGNNIKEDLQKALLIPVYYDAWKNDSDEDPVLSIIYNIINTLSVDVSLKEKKIEVNNLISEIIKVFINFDLENISVKEDILAEITLRKDAEEKIKQFLNRLIPERGNKIIMLIDELDRCRPNYAVKMLERIKHYFANDNIIFVFSVNTSELQHTISNVYGTGFDSGRYLDRFFDFRVSLPSIDIENYILPYTKDIMIFDVLNIITNTLNLQMRELCRYRSSINLLNETMKKHGYPDSDDPAMIFINCFLLPIAYIYKLIDMNIYRQFIRGENHTLLIEILMNSGKFVSFKNKYMLKNNESFSEDDLNQEYVNLKERTIGMYQFICKTAPSSYPDKTFGEIRIQGKHIEYFNRMLTELKLF